MRVEAHKATLTIHESAEAVRVVFNNDPDDWLVEDRKENDFPARQWAERIINLYQQQNVERAV